MRRAGIFGLVTSALPGTRHTLCFLFSPLAASGGRLIFVVTEAELDPYLISHRARCRRQAGTVARGAEVHN
jgi:hypothetical protein